MLEAISPQAFVSSIRVHGSGEAARALVSSSAPRVQGERFIKVCIITTSQNQAFDRTALYQRNARNSGRRQVPRHLGVMMERPWAMKAI